MTVKIEKKITGYSVAREEEEQQAPVQQAVAEEVAPDTNVVHMTEKLERPEMLLGSTYKIKTPLSEHALYVTINDVAVFTLEPRFYRTNAALLDLRIFNPPNPVKLLFAFIYDPGILSYQFICRISKHFAHSLTHPTKYSIFDQTDAYRCSIQNSFHVGFTLPQFLLHTFAIFHLLPELLVDF